MSDNVLLIAGLHRSSEFLIDWRCAGAFLEIHNELNRVIKVYS